MKILDTRTVGLIVAVLILATVVFAAALNLSAQTKDEMQVREVLTQNTTAFAQNDMATLDKIWANDEAVTVFENGHKDFKRY